MAISAPTLTPPSKRHLLALINNEKVPVLETFEYMMNLRPRLSKWQLNPNDLIFGIKDITAAIEFINNLEDSLYGKCSPNQTTDLPVYLDQNPNWRYILGYYHLLYDNVAQANVCFGILIEDNSMTLSPSILSALVTLNCQASLTADSSKFLPEALSYARLLPPGLNVEAELKIAQQYANRFGYEEVPSDWQDDLLQEQDIHAWFDTFERLMRAQALATPPGVRRSELKPRCEALEHENERLSQENDALTHSRDKYKRAYLRASGRDEEASFSLSDSDEAPSRRYRRQ